jgi:hypothetical protein
MPLLNERGAELPDDAVGAGEGPNEDMDRRVSRPTTQIAIE